MPAESRIPASTKASTRFGRDDVGRGEQLRATSARERRRGGGVQDHRHARRLCPARIARIAVRMGISRPASKHIAGAEDRVGKPVDVVGREVAGWPRRRRRSCSRRPRPRRSGRRPKRRPAIDTDVTDVDALPRVELESTPAAASSSPTAVTKTTSAPARRRRPPGWPPCRPGWSRTLAQQGLARRGREAGGRSCRCCSTR